MVNLIGTYIEITIAVVLGLLIDKGFALIEHHFAHGTIRVFAEFTIDIFIVILINLIYQRLGIKEISAGAYFISVFLGVQQSLFNEIYRWI